MEICRKGLLTLYAECAKCAYQDVKTWERQQAKKKKNPKWKPSFNYRLSPEEYYSAVWWLDEMWPAIKWIFEDNSKEYKIGKSIPDNE